MSFGIDINGGIALRSYFLKVSEAQNIAQLLIVDPVCIPEPFRTIELTEKAALNRIKTYKMVSGNCNT